jgi:hypothetical protein
MRYACPCCGFLTLSELPPGTFAICPICYWEDDNVQFNDSAYGGGANEESLRQARANYREFGASSRRVINLVRHPVEVEKPMNPLPDSQSDNL